MQNSNRRRDANTLALHLRFVVKFLPGVTIVRVDAVGGKPVDVLRTEALKFGSLVGADFDFHREVQIIRLFDHSLQPL
jgi:hypothetical protein